jgi:hypothetical protein
MTDSTADPVSAAEIASLLAWARSLSQAGRSVDPDERATYLAAKTALLARITRQHPDTDPASAKDTL